MFRPLAVLLLFVTYVTACSPTVSTQTLTPITLQLNRPHGAQLAGFYAAIANGDYAREGIALNFIEGGTTIDTRASVVDGTAQFGLAGGDVIMLGRGAGMPIKAIATILRREPFVFFSLAESGITRPEDFVGKKVLVSATSRPRLHTLLGMVGVKPDQVFEVTTGDYTGLYNSSIDVAGGFVNNTVLQAQREGHKVNIIYLDNYGMHFYADTLFATDDYIAGNPDLITRFLRATFDGWQYALENPEESASLAIHYNPNLNVELESAKVVAALPYVNTGEDHIGWMKPEIWSGMMRVMREQGILPDPLPTEDVYTLQFIQKIYGGTAS